MKGKVTLVDFWATWCAPCRKSMPELQSLHEKYRARGFSVVGVSIDEGKDAARKVKKFVDAKKITYPIVIDSEKSPTWERFRVKAVPAAFLVDQEGRIVAYDKQARVPAMRHIDYGLGAFRKDAFAPYAEGEAFDLAAVYRRLLGEGRLAGFDVPGRFYEIGSPAGLEETREYLARTRSITQ